MYFAYKYARRKYKERQSQQARTLTSTDDEPVDQEARRPDSTSNDVAPPRTERAVGLDEPASADISTPATVRAHESRASQAGKVSTLEGKKEKKKKPEPTAEELAEQKRRRVYRWKIILGLWGPFSLQALDTTVIASALPYIAQDFNQVKQLNWIISAFNLTSAAFLPFWAQITDIFGRHVAVQAATFIVMIGSAICTGSPTSAFGVLLFGRALQGVGAAGIVISVRTIMADRVSLADLALNWTIFALVSGVSFSIGPVIGGYLTTASWRWCFAINLPIALVTIIVIVLVLRKELLGPQPLPELQGRDTSTRHGRFLARLSTIDYGGQMLFLWGLGLLILALTWGGGTYSWSSATVLAPLIIGAVLTIAWVFYERSMAPGLMMSRIFPYQRAMMPWKLLAHRNIGLIFLINFAVGMAMFAVIYFMDLYFALVEGKSSSDAGVALLYYLPGLGVGAYMAMFSSNVWPRQTLPALIFGGLTAAVGITVLPWAIHVQKTAVIYAMMALVGHGVGMRMNPGSLHGLAYFPQLTAPISCLVAFAMPFGGLVGLTIMSTVFTNKSGPGQKNPKDGIMWAFIAMIPFMWVCVLLTMCLGNVWLLKEGGHDVVKGNYLWSLLTRRKLEKDRVIRGRGVMELNTMSQKEKDPETGLHQASDRDAEHTT